jgi:uncharacterized protein (DUF2141 family)
MKMSAAAFFGVLVAGPALTTPAMGEPAAEKKKKRATTKRCQERCVVIAIDGFDSDKGQVLVALFRSADGFPGNVKKAAMSRAVKIKNRHATVIFANVPAGEFAIAVHHDADGNFKMATNWMNAPTEAYGASRNARRRFGPPRYKDARLTLGARERKNVRIHVD